MRYSHSVTYVLSIPDLTSHQVRSTFTPTHLHPGTVMLKEHNASSLFISAVSFLVYNKWKYSFDLVLALVHF